MEFRFRNGSNENNFYYHSSLKGKMISVLHFTKYTKLKTSLSNSIDRVS